jgi:hypothetical protein
MPKRVRANRPETLAELKRAQDARPGRPFTTVLKQWEAARKRGEEETFLQGNRDFSFLQNRTEEFVDLLGSPVHFVPVSTERDPRAGVGPKQSAGVDPLDGDILDPGFFDNPDLEDQRLFNMKSLVEHEPSKQNLKRYGVDEERDVIFHIPISTFEVKELVSEWRVNGADLGDLIVWDGTWYQIQNVHRGSYFGSRDLPHLIACAANRYRHNSVPTEDAAITDFCPEEVN